MLKVSFRFMCVSLPCRSAANLLSILALIAIGFVGSVTFSTPGLAKAKYAAYVLDVKTGRVLYSRNANAHRYPASLTKMMTLYLTFQELRAGRIKKNTRFKVSRLAASQAPSKLGLRPGQRVPVEKLILALVTKSANDASVVLAEGISGTHKRFARRMTTTARSIGMKRTTFKNANGLPNSRQRTTARDMSVLALRLMKDFPQYYPYFRVRAFKYMGRTYYTHNRLLRNFAGTDGVKTGYTRASGFNLTSSVRRKGKHLIGVVLGGRTGRWRDQHMRTLLSRAFPKASARSIRVATRNRRIQLRDLRIIARKLNRVHPTRVVFSKPPKVPAPPAAANPTKPQVMTASAVTQPVKILPVSAVTNANRTGALPELGNDWRIQVGAFAVRHMAKKRLDFIIGQKFRPLRNAQAKIVRAKKNGRDLYRVRFAGLDEDGAEAVCMRLQDDKVGCYSMAPPHPREQASR